MGKLVVGISALMMVVIIGVVVTVATVLGQVSSGTAGSAGQAGSGGLDQSAEVPADWQALYRQAAATCPGLPWSLLAAIGTVETGNGSSTAPGVSSGANSAGAEGPEPVGAESGLARKAIRSVRDCAGSEGNAGMVPLPFTMTSRVASAPSLFTTVSISGPRSPFSSGPWHVWHVCS